MPSYTEQQEATALRLSDLILQAIKIGVNNEMVVVYRAKSQHQDAPSDGDEIHNLVLSVDDGLFYCKDVYDTGPGCYSCARAETVPSDNLDLCREIVAIFDLTTEDIDKALDMLVNDPYGIERQS
jgi:hypothetical protein